MGLGDIIYAVNCGGEAHTDVYGVQFQKDSNKVNFLIQDKFNYHVEMI